MLNSIENKIKEILLTVGFAEPINLVFPPKEDMGDVAVACFELAKKEGKSPVVVANEMAERIFEVCKVHKVLKVYKVCKVKSRNVKKGLIENVKAVGPYVNIYLNASEVARMTLAEVKKKKFGGNDVGKGKKVMIEYPSNNTHKEFHVGHLRNACIGNFLVQVYKKCGYKVYPVNYLNDFGSHVGKCLWGLNKFHQNELPSKNKQKWLGEIYVEASGLAKENPLYASEISQTQKSLEAHDKNIWPLYLQTRQWSIKKFEELFKELNVRHVEVFYEKDLKKEAQKTVDKLLNTGIAKVGDGGAIVVDLSPYKLDVALVRKSDGTGLYLTSDLPLAEKKYKKYNVDESIMLTGYEQNFYFKQLFKILELYGFKKKTTHIGYGLITTAGGKMSSRAGGVVLYEDLRDVVKEKIMVETKKRHEDWSKKKISDVVHKLTMAVQKFDMQKHETFKNIVFDINEATSFDGYSAPYILYAVARMNSLLKKGRLMLKRVNADLLREAEEKKICLMLGEYENIIEKALQNYNPSVIARYCFDLAQAFNDYYNKHKIIDEDNAAISGARLSLTKAVKDVLDDALGLLTIKTVEEM